MQLVFNDRAQTGLFVGSEPARASVVGKPVFHQPRQISLHLAVFSTQPVQKGDQRAAAIHRCGCANVFSGGLLQVA